MEVEKIEQEETEGTEEYLGSDATETTTTDGIGAFALVRSEGQRESFASPGDGLLLMILVAVV